MIKVLVTNNTLNNVGGSETYALALITELNKRDNIIVEAYSPVYGIIADEVKKLGVKLVYELEDKYDLILASHLSTTTKINEFKSLNIQTCHGIYPYLEQPDPNMDKFVSISYEVRTHLFNKSINSEIIHNGIDCERFSPKKEINDKLTNILSLSQSDYLNTILKKVCDENKYNLTCLNKFINPIMNVEDVINENDLVISLGRGTYESMACGRNVVILDKRPYINKPPIGDGILTIENINDYLLNNCSGRFTNNIFDEETIKSELLKYDKKNGVELRDFSLKYLNIKTQVDKYLKIYESNSNK